MAHVVLDELLRHGVGDIVIAPGSRSAALAMTAVTLDFDVHVEIDERSAGFFALGLGRGGRPAAVVTTSGTAVANLLPAVIEADLGAVPLLVLASDRPPEMRERGANQTIRQNGIFGQAVRWEFDPGPANHDPGANALWRSMVSRAASEALGGSGLPGPVHLNLPFREPLVPASDDGRVSASPFTHDTTGRSGGRPWTAATSPPRPTLSRHESGSRTLVVAGEDPMRAEFDVSGVAYVAEPHSPLPRTRALGCMHWLSSHARAGDLLPDSVVTLGRVGLSRPLSTWLSELPTVRIDPSGRWLDPLSDATSVVRSAAIPTADPGWLHELRSLDSAVRDGVNAFLDRQGVATEPRVVRDVARALPLDGTLVVASSMPIRDLDLFMDVDVDVVANRGASGIDGFVSTALGVAESRSGPTVAIAGDLSMLHDSNGLLVEPRPSCSFVVIDNDGGGIFSMLPQARFPESFEQVFGTPHGRSFRSVAELHGLGYHEVEDPNDLVGTLGAVVGAPGVTLIVVKTGREENARLHAEVTSVAHSHIDDLLG